MADYSISLTDPDEVKIVIGPHRVVGFPADGTEFWTPVKVNPNTLVATEGVDGNVSMRRMKNKLVRATLTLLPTSPSVTALYAFFREKEETISHNSFFPISCVHPVRAKLNSLVTEFGQFESFPPGHSYGADGIVTITFFMHNPTGAMHGLAINDSP